MNLLLAVVLFSFQAMAQDYTLSQAENEHFRDYTREEFMARIGADSALLPYYACNGVNENDPFWPAIRQNQQGDSLKIQLYKENGILTYKEGRFFNQEGRETRDFSNVFLGYVKEALEKIETIPEGKLVLRQLELSHFPLTISFGGNSFNPHGSDGKPYRGIYEANSLSILSQGRMTSQEIPFQSIGAGGKINWNPQTKDLPAHIALAHEMFHAFDSIRGILDMRFVVGDSYEGTLLSEYRAVYFENIARKASGVEYRTHYGQDQTGPGVLDEHGDPRKMPSPCLK